MRHTQAPTKRIISTVVALSGTIELAGACIRIVWLSAIPRTHCGSRPTLGQRSISATRAIALRS